MSQLYFARRPFEYGVPSQTLDFGQVVALGGFRTDEKLIEYGHLAPFKTSPTHSPLECNRCGARFVDHQPLIMHGRKRHPETPRSHQEEDQFLDAEAKRLDRDVPLNMGGGTVEVHTEPVKKRRGRPPKSASN